MTKSDIVTRIAALLSLTESQAKRIVQEVLEAVAVGLEKEDKVELRGFGTFTAKTSNARQGRNPKTGEAIPIPARRVPRFHAAKELKERCKRG